MSAASRLLVFSLCIIPGVFYAFYGWLSYDDEGYVLRFAELTLDGYRPYLDFSPLYGPLFIWLNALVFASFGVSTIVSRITTVMIAATTSLLLSIIFKQVVKHQAKGPAKQSDFIGLIPGLLWFYLSSYYFRESLHPGWWMALILAAQGYLFCKNHTHPFARTHLAMQGLLSSALIALKPHIGLSSALAVFSILLSQQKQANWSTAQRMFCILPGLFFTSIWGKLILGFSSRMTLSMDLVVYLSSFVLVFALAILLPLRFRFPTRLSLTSGIAFWMTALTVFSGLVWGLAVYLYGFAPLVSSLYLKPASLAPLLLELDYRFTFEVKVFVVFIVTGILLGLVKAKHGKTELTVFHSITAFFCLAVVALPHTAQVIGWPLIYTLASLSLIQEDNDETKYKIYCILTLSLFHFPHMFPISGAQCFYATPLGWVILFWVLGKPFLASSYPGSAKQILLTLLSTALSLLLALGVWGGYKTFIKDSSQAHFTGSPLIKLPESLVKETNALFSFLKKEITPNTYFLTLPPTHSLEIWAGSKLPFASPLWLWSSLEEQEQIVSFLAKVPFVVHVTCSGDYQADSSPPPSSFVPSLLNQTIINSYREVPAAQWLNQGNSSCLKLFRRSF